MNEYTLVIDEAKREIRPEFTSWAPMSLESDGPQAKCTAVRVQFTSEHYVEWPL